MIFETFCNVVKNLMFFLFDFIQLPAFPSQLATSVNDFMNLLFNNIGLIGFFLPWDIIKICVPLVIAIANLDKLYDLTMWIVRKIPLLGMQ